MQKRLEKKLVLQLIILCVAGIIAGGVLELYQREQWYKSVLIPRSTAGLQQRAQLLNEPLSSMNLERLEQLVTAYLTDPDILACKVLKGRNVVIYMGKQPGEDTILNLDQPDAAAHEYDDAMIHYAPIPSQENSIGTLEMTVLQPESWTSVNASGMLVFGGLAFVFLVIGASLFVLLRKTCLLPLAWCVQTAQHIAGGDLTLRLPQVTSRNEFAAVTTAFTHVVSYLQKIAATLTHLSQGDFPHPISPQSAKDVLGQTCMNLSATLDNMVTTATALLEGEQMEPVQINSPDDRLGALLQKLHDFQGGFRKMTQQCSQLHTLSDEFSHLSARIITLIQETIQQASLISMNSEQIQRGAQTMAIASREMASNTHEIAMNTPELEQVAGTAVERVTSANEVIDDLKIHSAEIGDIIQLITDISQQTNLLALNATIEAARAGEAGKGFAVVANEIKNLSRETAESTESIIRKLEAIQYSSEKVREVIDDVSIAVIEIHHATGLIGDSLNEQTSITSDIAQSLNEAIEGSQQISQAITELTATLQHTTDAVNHVQNMSTRLTSLNEMLQHGVAQLTERA